MVIIWVCNIKLLFYLLFPSLDHISLQSIAWSVEDPLEEPLSSDLEELPHVDQQVQSPPAPVHHSPVSPASAHNSIVDLTTEGEFSAPNITHNTVNYCLTFHFIYNYSSFNRWHSEPVWNRQNAWWGRIRLRLWRETLGGWPWGIVIFLKSFTTLCSLTMSIVSHLSVYYVPYLVHLPCCKCNKCFVLLSRWQWKLPASQRTWSTSTL